MTKAQLDMFATAEPAATASVSADPAEVRRKLQRVLAELASSASMPWDEVTLRFHLTVFPQMTDWLPDDEAAGLRAAFAAEIERLA